MSFISNPGHPQVLVYEFLSAGGVVPGAGPDELASMRAQGTAMRDAMLADLAALPGVQTLCVVPGDLAQAAAMDLPVPGVQPVVLQSGASHGALLCRAALDGAVVWAVAPETGGVLEALAQAVPSRRWLGCTADAIAVAASKSATSRQLAAQGIAVPQAATSSAAGWVVKPDDGVGAADIRHHASQAAAQADARQRAVGGAACVVEPWVAGDALSLSLCCQGGTARLLSINRQHIEVDGEGAVHFRGVTPAALDPVDERGQVLGRLGAAVARALPGLRGYVGVDVVCANDRRPVVIEVNPRLTMAYVGLSGRLGFNVAQRLLATLPEAWP